MNAEAQLKSFIDRFAPEIATLGETALATMRERFPSAVQLVYDNYNALVIGFGPSERASEAIFSIALFPRSVNLCFLQVGKTRLKDPNRLLLGSGTTNRFIRLESAAALEDPRIMDLMTQALDAAKVPFLESLSGHLVIKSISEKQRPRRPDRRSLR